MKKVEQSIGEDTDGIKTSKNLTQGQNDIVYFAVVDEESIKNDELRHEDGIANSVMSKLKIQTNFKLT
jgi:hypothetical protein